jgi:hypothetical protein
MIQAIRDDSGTNTNNYMYLNLYDEVDTSLTAYLITRPLIALKSKQTNNTKYFVPFKIDGQSSCIGTCWGGANTSRYTKLEYLVVDSPGGEVIFNGSIYMGTDDFPYGLYDMTIYQNNTNTNTNPANAIKVLYTGLWNLTSKNNPALTYTEYTTNDSDTESVYITN